MKRCRRYTGIFCGTGKGYGFVSVKGMEKDVFVDAGKTFCAFDGDEVEVMITRQPEGHRGLRRSEGEIVKILSHNTKVVVGTFQYFGEGFGFVVPDSSSINKDIFIQKGHGKNAADGDKVVAEILTYGDQASNPEGKITEVLGRGGKPDVEMLSITRSFALRDTFPQRVINQAIRVAKPVSDGDLWGRKDLRSLRMITIDGEDSKDLDDAVSLELRNDKYILGVHIADVANYVQEGSALDREALKRGTSLYMANQVIPMLPPELSNGICSLNQGEDRLALSCMMTLDFQGHLLDSEIVESVINVDARMTYPQVKELLEEENHSAQGTDPELMAMLGYMEKLSKIIRRQKKSRGTLNFDFPEAKVIVGQHGEVTDIIPYEKNVATDMIEDFMILANETVAETFFWQELPFLYRVHEKPDPEKARELAVFVKEMGFHLHVGNNGLRAREVQKLLLEIESSPQRDLIMRIILRTMKKAEYACENTGHFGLASSCYTHFTSPIRRYPDLQIHRIIKETLRGRMTQARQGHYTERLPSVAAESSRLEKRAQEAEREALKLKKAEFVKRHIGEKYTGIISGVTRRGIYVELGNTVEGLVRAERLTDDKYDFDGDKCEYIGKHHKKRYRLGQKCDVVVFSGDILRHSVEFCFPEEEKAWKKRE